MSQNMRRHCDNSNERPTRSIVHYGSNGLYCGDTASSQFASRDGADFVELDPPASPPTTTAPSHRQYPSIPNNPMYHNNDQSTEENYQEHVVTSRNDFLPYASQDRQYIADSGEYDHPSMRYEERLDYERRRRCHRQQSSTHDHYDARPGLRDSYDLDIYQSGSHSFRNYSAHDDGYHHSQNGNTVNVHTRIPQEERTQNMVLFSDKSYPQRVSEQPHDPKVQSAALLFKQHPLIEISPGLQARLRGASETKDAVRRDEFQPVNCLGCQHDLFCMSDAAFVLCPECRVVSPLDGTEHANSSSHVHKKGVGLGFTFATLNEIQQEIMEERAKAGQEH